MRRYAKRQASEGLSSDQRNSSPVQSDVGCPCSGERARRGCPRSQTCSLRLCEWHKASGHMLSPERLAGLNHARLCRIFDRDITPVSGLGEWRPVYSRRRGVLDQRVECNTDPRGTIDSLPDRQLSYRPRFPTSCRRARDRRTLVAPCFWTAFGPEPMSRAR